ncbi:MAG: DNA mismatch repair protein MutS [Clostridia bacterium]|nr:DNA mismatch repair protein MutS [Clostridia bacterium]
MGKLSPMMEQFFEIKNRYKDYILFYRVGDFYEMFFDDAIAASRELQLTLTGKDCGLEERAPMCGVPFHSYENYAAKLVANGYKVAICEQVEDPKSAKGLVRRDVIKVITPGTVTQSSMLDDSKNNYLACICFSSARVALSFADISTGDIEMTVLEGTDNKEIINEIGRFSPSEILFGGQAYDCQEILDYARERLGALVTRLEPDDNDAREQALLDHFRATDLDSLGIPRHEEAIDCLFYLLAYIAETQKCDIGYLDKLKVFQPEQYMELDASTRRNLELTESIRRSDKKGTLFYVLNQTKTSAGARLLRAYLERPLVNISEINRRLAAVEELKNHVMQRDELRQLLSKTYDMERLMTRVMLGTCNARDLNALGQTFGMFPEIKAVLSDFGSSLLKQANLDLSDMGDLHQLITSAIAEEPPLTIREGDIIRDGYDAEVDECRTMTKDSEQIMCEWEAEEKEKTGIKSLKISYNKVFGYYIEVTKLYYDLVPEHYIRKQTLVNCERYITEDLKKLETKILYANQRCQSREYELFCEVRNTAGKRLKDIQRAASALAVLDVLCSFAQVAQDNNYVNPVVDESNEIRIVDGRHPVVESVSKGTLFVPNDTVLNQADQRLALITGPNMAGKSTYMRQVAVIVLMAQIGCFVPAKSAHIGVVDKIFTRVGASDDLSSGQSTFMVEMTEVAHILDHATSASLLIFDEIGRGTSTYDGMSIARAVMEYVNDPKKLGAKTLFATHYHELCALGDQGTGIVNYNIAVKKRGDDIIFLRKIVSGGADESYGIEVAALAGVRSEVVKRAKKILNEIDKGIAKPERPARQVQEEDAQISLGYMEQCAIIERLKELDVTTLTPIETMGILYELAQKAKEL